MKSLQKTIVGLAALTGIVAGGITLAQHNDWVRSFLGGKPTLEREADKNCQPQHTAGRPALEEFCRIRAAKRGRTP